MELASCACSEERSERLASVCRSQGEHLGCAIATLERQMQWDCFSVKHARDESGTVRASRSAASREGAFDKVIGEEESP